MLQRSYAALVSQDRRLCRIEQPCTVYESVIGLEVHCQLRTASKAFSSDSVVFGARPNRHVDVVSLGYPGTLPVPNIRVVEYAARMGLATHCTVADRSVMARKHYFYPDLPKGYQISQFERPVCIDGYVDIEADGPRRIGVARIHIEEDAGKSLHDQDAECTLLDFNRCGVPLIEIVSEPDLRSGREAYLYMQKIRQLVRYLEICDGNMEEGSLRCDANVSIRPVGDTALGVKTEIKNMNSFRYVERAIDYETARQKALARRGEVVAHQTLLWDASSGTTRPMRSKEEAHDYRYFPDPDLPPVVVSASLRAAVLASLPELPAARRKRFQEQLGLPAYDANLLTEERSVADYFEDILRALRDKLPDGELHLQAKAVSNVVMTQVLRAAKDRTGLLEQFPITPARMAALVALRLSQAISSSGMQEIFTWLLNGDGEPEQIARTLKLMQVSDDDRLLPVVEEVLATFPSQVATFRSGKTSVLGFFIGQVMRRFGSSADPVRVRCLLLERIGGEGDA